MRAAVMGLGSWGTAFGMVLADAGNEVVLWGRDAELAATVNESHENPRFHPGITLPSQLRATADPTSALDDAELVVLAVPAQTLRANLTNWQQSLASNCRVVSLLKGLEIGTLARMSEVISEVAAVDAHRVAVISGPNLAREVALKQPTASVVACAVPEVAELIQRTCQTAYFRPYTNTDVVGVELGGVVKNIIALATGMAQGMGFGDNSKAAIITRGLAEMTRLGVAMGANPMTFMGLAGIGDLVATCSSPLSRNRTFGENLGRGMSLAEAVAATSQTAEGVTSSSAVLELGSKHGVDMPITAHVAGVVHDGRSPRDMVQSLMSRVAKPEW
ncbi:MAG TPA: NAD(P)H-dependent glycerol-3-phosphate dehydrogenase [Actinomycetes bacterium]|nr:NAD(P)H-dependent glycerol-3-phosphate dehydrogenase [Actinomycetes bacterium]